MNLPLLLNRRRRGAFAGAFESYLSDAALAFMSKIAANPVLDDPDLALFVNCDEHGVFAYKGDQGFGNGEALYADPNAVLANAATGPARPFIGASGGYEIALHSLTGDDDFSNWTAAGTGVGGYESVSGCSGSGNYIFCRWTAPIASGTTVKMEVDAYGVSPGDTVRLEVNTDTGGASFTVLTIAAEGETLSVEHTLTGNASRVDFRIGQGTGTKAAWNPKNCWGRITSLAGIWPMQNLGGFTNVTLPKRTGPWWGVGVEYDPDTGKPRRFVTGGERGELVTASTLTAASVLISGSTKADRTDYVMGVGERWPGLTVTGTGATWNRCNFVVGKTVTSGQTYVGVLYYAAGTSGRAYVDCRNVSGATSSTLYAAVGGSWTFGGAAGPMAVVSDTVWSGSVRKLVFTFVPNFTGTCEVGFGPHSAVTGETIIGYAAQFAQGASEYPFMPVLEGGQTVHAAQKIERAANEFMPLGANVYSALGQIGAIGSSGSPWESSTGEGRFSVSGNVLTLSAGSAAEIVSLLAAPLGLSDGDVVEVDVTLARTDGGIEFRSPAGVVQVALGLTSPNTRTVKRQFTVSGGVVCQLRAGNTQAAGSITINAVRQVQSSEAALVVDRTVRALGVVQFAAALHRDSTASTERFLEVRQTAGNTLEANTVVASTDDASTLDGSVATGDRQKLVVSRSASEMTGKAEGVTAPAANAVGAVDDFARLTIGTNGWNGGDADAGDIHAIAVFSRVLTSTEQGELVDA